VTAAEFRFETYAWRDERENILVHGFNNDAHLIVMPPLFEELNLLRAFIGDVARLLAGRGIACWLPDLPGTGESLRALEDISWQDWRDAARTAGARIEAITGAAGHVAAFRGGALLADAVPGRSCWAYAPAEGADLLRYLKRVQAISDLENGSEAADLAGYNLSSELRAELEAAKVVPSPVPTRSLRADAFGTHAPLWHRGEPGRDHALSAAIADDIAEWIAQCDG
jgi:pimeloyl-ACP methyl ester carboxylesterase